MRVDGRLPSRSLPLFIGLFFTPHRSNLTSPLVKLSAGLDGCTWCAHNVPSGCYPTPVGPPPASPSLRPNPGTTPLDWLTSSSPHLAGGDGGGGQRAAAGVRRRRVHRAAQSAGPRARVRQAARHAAKSRRQGAGLCRLGPPAPGTAGGCRATATAFLASPLHPTQASPSSHLLCTPHTLTRVAICGSKGAQMGSITGARDSPNESHAIAHQAAFRQRSPVEPSIETLVPDLTRERSP